MEINIGWFYKLKQALKRKPKVTHQGYKTSLDIPPISRTRTITMNKNVFIVNGKRLEPGTPEYESAMADFMLGMDKFNDGMKQFDKSMSEMGDMFRNIK